LSIQGSQPAGRSRRDDVVAGSDRVYEGEHNARIDLIRPHGPDRAREDVEPRRVPARENVDELLVQAVRAIRDLPDVEAGLHVQRVRQGAAAKIEVQNGDPAAAALAPRCEVDT
jgi:hypothetical protein